MEEQRKGKDNCSPIRNSKTATRSNEFYVISSQKVKHYLFFLKGN
jgi:hypothetical protein